jgi:ElaA protein
MEKIVWKHKNWEGLDKNDLHEILILRAEIFVVEQNCVYQDIDNKDPKAIHLFGKIDNKIVAYTRIFNEGSFYKEISFGRALVLKVKISAQAHLKNFYKKHGFIEKGKEYLEDGIPHVSMEYFS